MGQADSNPPGVAAAGGQRRGGQPHTAQTATRGEEVASWDADVNVSPLKVFPNILFCGAGVFGEEVCRSAKKGPLRASAGGSGIRNSYQPLPCQRESVQ